MPDDVARLVLGTAALGLPYGLPPPGRDRPEVIAEEQACCIIEEALAAGIQAFDTAPAYGEAEARLGVALRGRSEVWTKIDPASASTPDSARVSLEASLRRLRRDRIGLLSWHNWRAELLERADSLRAWEALRGEGAADAFGATTYGAVDAVAAVSSGLFSVVQVEWNLLNQRTLNSVVPVARQHGVRLALRSVFLQGVLTPKGSALPDHLRGLESSVARATELARESRLELASFALRAALDQDADHVLVGVDSKQALATAVAAARSAALGPDRLPEVAALDRSGDALVDPRTWPRA